MFRLPLFLILPTIALPASSPAFEEVDLSGLRMAFEASIDGRDCICLLEGLGGEAEPKVLVDRFASVSDPRWSPDGRYIAFAAQSGGRWGIYLMEVGSGRMRALITSRDVRYSNPRWSPDGRRLAFNAYLGGWRNDIYVLDVKGKGDPRPVVENFSALLLDWTSDGREICFTVGWKSSTVYAVEVDRGKPVRLNPAENVFQQLGQFREVLTIPQAEAIYDLSFSPDGSKAVVTADLPPPRFTCEMFLVDLLSGKVEEIKVRGEQKVGGKYNPRWSPDGKLIFFSGYIDRLYECNIMAITPRGELIWRLKREGYDGPFDIIPLGGFSVRPLSPLMPTVWGEVKCGVTGR